MKAGPSFFLLLPQLGFKLQQFWGGLVINCPIARQGPRDWDWVYIWWSLWYVCLLPFLPSILHMVHIGKWSWFNPKFIFGVGYCGAMLQWVYASLCYLGFYLRCEVLGFSRLPTAVITRPLSLCLSTAWAFDVCWVLLLRQGVCVCVCV